MRINPKNRAEPRIAGGIATPEPALPPAVDDRPLSLLDDAEYSDRHAECVRLEGELAEVQKRLRDGIAIANRNRSRGLRPGMELVKGAPAVPEAVPDLSSLADSQSRLIQAVTLARTLREQVRGAAQYRLTRRMQPKLDAILAQAVGYAQLLAAAVAEYRRAVANDCRFEVAGELVIDPSLWADNGGLARFIRAIEARQIQSAGIAA